ncbi:MAG: phosphoglycerate dehydrogenase [Coprococcus sp.]|uniref:phosphoglycerate dehydrogenase n=1 Tax=Coprococcus sp. OM04-5BH TaxID=2293093 RepID=UPI000E4A39FB|nr:phosphoglycerate dehydrogenase [Coprococcus sp. OM04-5BH]MEE0035282.1 phosphoglycerate dehydrogenase [Coprococcus sp.]RHV31972.1 3-phosphoglycerate dehydrogenase [Coprococcus sp. OM04-5BH]
MAVKVNCLNPIAACGMELLPDTYEITDNYADAEAVLVRSASMHDLELSDKLLAVARAGAGVNNIPLDKCAEKGIVVFNTPGANANGVKELVVAALLMASRDLVGGYNWVMENAADPDIAKKVEKQKKNYAGNEISGKKLGVIGLGAIGAKVANIAVRLGMEVYGYDPYVSVDAAWGLSKYVKHITNVEDIYKECDYITVHVPALDSTKGMINAGAFALMKDGVKILNFARDVLVNEDDIKAAIESGKVAKYMTDFPNPKIAGFKNVVALPHLGASTEESEDNCAIMACKEIKDFIDNGNIKNSVNYPNVNMGVCTDVARITICHKNIPNMLTQFTSVFSKKGGNVSGMISQARGDYAYSILDSDAAPTAEDVAALEAIDGVVKVRVIK